MASVFGGSATRDAFCSSSCDSMTAISLRFSEECASKTHLSRNFPCNIRHFVHEMEKASIQELWRRNLFSTIIHGMTAHHTRTFLGKNHESCSKSNLLGLMRMLHLWTRAKSARCLSSPALACCTLCLSRCTSACNCLTVAGVDLAPWDTDQVVPNRCE